MAEEKQPGLFTPLTLGNLELKNRFIMAPLTRSRADEGNVPNDLMAEYYAQRASGGLIIAEFTTIKEDAVTFYLEGGIWSEEQVAGWKKVTEAVHKAGGQIFCQIAHGGRAAHPSNNNGAVPIAPSELKISSHTGEHFNPSGEKVDNVMPRALKEDEIAGLVACFAKAAENAVAAGFDGVEVHGANGYLVDQFLRESSNKREDKYGGAPENRSRFLREVLEAVVKAIGKEKVGLRISPLNSFQDMSDSDPVALTEHVVALCNEIDIAFLHVMRADFFQQQTGDVVTPARKFKNVLMVNMGYKPEEAEKTIGSGQADAVAFGTLFLANPDLPERVKAGVELNKPNPNTFYTRGAEGYTDYPFMAKKEEEKSE